MTRLPLIVLLAGLALLTSCASGGHSVNLYGGSRVLDDSDLDDVDSPFYYGVDGVLALNNEGLLGWGLEGGYGHSDDDNDDVEIDIDEIYGGLRVFFPAVPIVKPYVSGGLTHMDAEFDDGVDNEDDDGYAPYARGGAAIQFGPFRFGADVRYVFDGSASPNGADLEGWIPTLFIGLGF